MELRPGYKQTEVGPIPEEWDVDKIACLASITTGAKNTQDRIDEGTYPFFVRSATVERINSFSFDGEAVLTAGDGVGTGKIFHYINGKFDFHQRVYKISEFGERLDGYFFYLYFSNNFYSRIMQMTAKSSVDSVRREMIADMMVPVPPLPQQRAIAAALDDVDNLISGLDRLIAKKRDIKQAAMQQLFTGKQRLPGFSGEWEVMRLENECEIITKGTTPTSIGRVFTRQGINFVKIESLTDGGKVIPDKLAAIDVQTHNLLKRSQLKENDLLFSIAGALGRTAIVKNELLPANTNQALAIVRLKQQSHILHDFLFIYLTSPMIKQHVEAINVQAAQANLSLEDVRNFKIQVPAPDEQAAIAAVLSDMDAEIANLEARRDKTHALKQGMMQELLTGRIRLV